MRLHPPERIDLGALLLRRSTDLDGDQIADAVAANLQHLAPWMPWASAAAGAPAVQRERLRATSAAWDAGREYEFLAFSIPDYELLGIL